MASNFRVKAVGGRMQLARRWDVYVNYGQAEYTEVQSKYFTEVDVFRLRRKRDRGHSYKLTLLLRGGENYIVHNFIGRDVTAQPV
jgi:hypothetical protein